MNLTPEELKAKQDAANLKWNNMEFTYAVDPNKEFLARDWRPNDTGHKLLKESGAEEFIKSKYNALRDVIINDRMFDGSYLNFGRSVQFMLSIACVVEDKKRNLRQGIVDLRCNELSKILEFIKEEYIDRTLAFIVIGMYAAELYEATDKKKIRVAKEGL